MARLAGHIPCEERQRAPPLPAFTAYKLEDSDGKDFPADEAKKSKKSLFTFSLQTRFQMLSSCVIFDFPTMKASVKRVMKKFLTSLLFVVPKANMLLFRHDG